MEKIMKLKSSKKYLLIFSLLFSTVINPQQKQKTEANADLIEYTNKEGLPSTNLSNIVQTKDGYIWISGIEGTYRFNGYEFEEIGTDIGLPTMQSMYYDSTNNKMYFASPTKFISFNEKGFTVYTENEGYSIKGSSGQTISFIRSDSKGRIWIGSTTPYVDKKNNGGLTYFQNDKFTVFDSTNFPLDNATDFIETPYGDLIFNSSGRNTRTFEGAYLALYKNGKFAKVDESMGVTLKGSMFFPDALRSSVDKEGNTWIAFNGGSFIVETANKSGVLMYDGNKFHQFTDFMKQLKSDQRPMQVYYSKNLNKLFLTTFFFDGELFNKNNNIIYEFDNGKWKPSNILKGLNDFKNMKSGKAINDFRFTNALFTKPNKYFPELFVLPGTIEDQSSKYPDQLFSLSEEKMVKFDALNGFHGISLDDGILLNTSKGLGIYYTNYSRMLTKKDGLLLTQGGITNTYADRDGWVWVSYSYSEIPDYARTENVGLNVWDGNNLRTITEKDGLSGNISFKTYQDSQKRIWIATSNGITMVNKILNSDGEVILKLKSIPEKSGKPYSTSNILETSGSDIYVWENYVRPAADKLIKSDYYLGRFDGEKFVEIKSPFSNADNSSKYSLFNLIEDNDKRLWFIGIFAETLKDISSAHSKIMLYDGKSWTKPPESWNVPSEQLHYVGKLKNGIYFLTVGGFYVFNGKSFVNLIDSANANADFRILKGASVAGTKTDIQAGENLYIRLRGRGLVIFDGTNLKFYTKKDGLPSANLSNPVLDHFREIVYFSSPLGSIKSEGDQFQLFPTDENIATGVPSSSTLDGFGNMVLFFNGVGLYIYKSEQKNYPLKITSVTVNKQFYYYSYPRTLPSSENSFVFNYAALNYRDPRQTTYEHFLEGFDKEWSRPSVLPYVEYQNLPSGNYTFRVRAITSNGVKTNEEIYSFRINPPWWLTWWAYGIYIIGFVGVLGGIRKYELERRKENENKKFLQIENDRKTKELEEARNLQLSMLPKGLPQLANLDIAVYMKTATEVGGDYYDFHVHLDGTLTVVLGDATGHGMMSGMMVSIMKSLFMSDRTNKELKPFFENASAAIKDMQLGRLMMALTCVQITNNKIITTNAGMPPLLIFRKSNQMIEELVISNMPLGAMKGVSYDVKELSIERGDTLLLMSDGFAELKNKNEELYGYRRARNSFEKAAQKEPEEIVNHLKEEGMRWTNNLEPDDDVTFVVIKVK
jgi:hypothetical protein